MKILFVSRSTQINQSDAPDHVVYNQGESLKKAGISLEYYLIKGKGLWAYLRHIRKLSAYVKANHYDLIHAHYSFSAFTATMALLFHRSVPLVVSLMGSDIRLRGLNRWLVKFLSRFFWKATIVKSHLMKELTGLEESAVIPNGVDLSKIRRVERKLLNDGTFQAGRDTPRILFAADPQRESKNYPLAQKAVSLLNRGDDLKVVYNTSHEQVLREIFISDVLILTSLWEGSPNIVKEAMACNCPVIATDVGDVRWLFGNEPGHFITGFTPEDVAGNIQQALKFSEACGRTNGRKRIMGLGLDAERVAKRIVEIYKQVLGICYDGERINNRSKLSELSDIPD